MSPAGYTSPLHAIFLSGSPNGCLRRLSWAPSSSLVESPSYRQGIDFDTFLNYFALGLLIFVVITLFYGIIAIHDVPYEIAETRPSAPRCHPRSRLGQPVHAPRYLAVPVDLGDAVPA